MLAKMEDVIRGIFLKREYRMMEMWQIKLSSSVLFVTSVHFSNPSTRLTI